MLNLKVLGSILSKLFQLERHTLFRQLNDASFKELTLRWNFGMLLFELYTGGAIPFSHVEPLDQLAALDRGERPPQPDCCPDKV